MSRLPAGTLHVFARLGSEVSRDRVGVREGEVRDLEVRMHAMGQVLGTVIDLEGKVLRNARIDCSSLDGIVQRGVRTNRQGRYRVQHLYPGSYRVVATYGKQRSERSVQVGPGAVMDGVDHVPR